MKTRSPKHDTLRRGVMTMALLALTLLPTAPCRAETANDKEEEAQLAGAKKAFRDHVEPFVKLYCVECHGDRPKAGLNLRVAVRKPADPAFARKWMDAIANVNAHDMPPDDADQPSDDERAHFIDAIAKIKYLSARDPGPFVIRRLTKTEYGNTLRDLIGADPAVTAQLPNEVAGEGYMNSLSPLQSEQYLEIANQVIQKMTPKAQKELFGEPPAKGADLRAEAGRIARRLARRAYRRPPSDDEVKTLVGVFDLGRENKLDYATSLRLMLKAVLVSPQFLFITPAREVDGEQKIVPLDDYQLASRLSYLLWATMPDAELSKLADAGKLHEPETLKAQAGRMLADRRARALFDGFGAQWLGLGELKDKAFDKEKFPQMTPAMRTAMYEEARLFFESIVRENRSVVSFVDSDHTYLNGTLAELYGMEKTVTGPEMRKVKLTNANRGGILGMPGILATTSLPNRTSPVIRGVWVLEQVLGEVVPPAPPNVPALEKQDQKKVANLTLRQRTELHRTNAVCNNCHKILDPIGFGLENFDAIGRWRDRDDTGGAIDAAGELPGGKHFSSPKELKALIAARKDDLARNLTEKLLAYALCRKLEGYDEIVVDRLMKVIAGNGYRMQTLVTEIVASYPFTNQRIQ
ncbi:MAG: DUF1592 domain-containing protein [Prosthecobacter sp.]